MNEVRAVITKSKSIILQGHATSNLLKNIYAFVFHMFLVRCLIIIKIVFYIMEFIKKLSLKRNFYKVVLTCFFN